MKVYRGFDELPEFKHATVTIGSFDGLHRGHRAIIDRLLTESRSNSGESIVITFDPHPRVVLGLSEGLRLLTPLEEKIEILEELGVENIIVVPFDRDFSMLSYSEFVSSYLIDRINLKSLIVGYDHHIGRNSEGRYNSLVKLSEELGFSISRVEELHHRDKLNLSSTVIRGFIATGKIEEANDALSYRYRIVGQSDSDGRIWINNPLKQLPPQGRYRADINGEDLILEINDNGVMVCEKVSRTVKIQLKEPLQA